MTQLLHRILPTVQKPARYTGGEYNEIQKNPEEVRVNVAFCFPDTYEIGMSNVGMRILYGVMNEMEGVWCQRAARLRAIRRLFLSFLGWYAAPGDNAAAFAGAVG